MPSENVKNLKKLCNHFGVSLATVLTGETDTIEGRKNPEDIFREDPWFDGYARIKIMRLIPRGKDNE